MQRMALRPSLRADWPGDFLAVDRSNPDDQVVLVRPSEPVPIRLTAGWDVCDCSRLRLSHIWISTLFLILGQTKQNLALSSFNLRWIGDRSGDRTAQLRRKRFFPRRSVRSSLCLWILYRRRLLARKSAERKRGRLRAIPISRPVSMISLHPTFTSRPTLAPAGSGCAPKRSSKKFDMKLTPILSGGLIVLRALVSCAKPNVIVVDS